MNAKHIWPIISCSWAALGFYRGAKQYSYNCDIEIKKYADKINAAASTKPKFMTTSCIFRGFIGTAAYVFPCTMPFVAYKEIYRLEMNIRGLDEEDINSTNYYDLFY
jgi:hypothetical protein